MKTMYFKVKCRECGGIISLFFDENRNDDIPDVKKGEYFEHKCPLCDNWSAMESLEDN